MTSLLEPSRTRSAPRTPPAEGRAPALAAALAGLGAATSVMAGCMVVAVIGWFASESGTMGTTNDALRVGADGWLLAQGAHLHLAVGGVSATITAIPLGLTLVCLWASHRFGRWAASSSAIEDARTLGLSVLILSGVYALVSLVAALLAASPSAEYGVLGSFLGAFVVALLGGGSGLLAGGREVWDWRAPLPDWVRSVAFGAVASVLLLIAVSSVVLAVALLADLGSAANVLSRLHADVSGGLLYTLLVAAVAPNAVLLTGSYLIGPGFALGTGTIVSPAAVTLGPVPAFPLLAALPAQGTPPAWSSALVAAPVVASVVAVLLMLRRRPAFSYETGAARGVGAGLAGGVLVTVLIALSGGAVGPGRMADLGAPLLDTLVAATVAMGVAGLVAGVAATWWSRRH